MDELMKTVYQALGFQPKCERCAGTGVVTLYNVDLGAGFVGDADEQPCPECAEKVVHHREESMTDTLDIVDRLRKWDGYDTHEVRLRDAAADEIERLRGAISDGAMWIPVGERLPDGRYTVLVFDPEDGGVQPAEFFAGGEPGGGFYGLGELDGRFSHVTHWMPLPGAPK